MKQYQKILVTGASGQLGRKLVRKLLAEGYSVRAQYRSKEQANRWNPEMVEIIIGDLLDNGWFDNAVDGCDAVIHCAAWVSMRQVDTDLMSRVNVEGTRRIVEASQKSESVKRLIHISSIAAIGGSKNGKPLDETAEYNLLKYNIPYFTTKLFAEREAFKFNGDRLDVIAVNPSIMISPPDRELTDRELKRIPNSLPAYISFGLNLVGTDDVVDGIIKTLEKGRPGGRYILAGENVDENRLFQLSEKYLNIKRPMIKVPKSMIYIVGFFSSLYFEIRKSFNKRTPPPRLSWNLARLIKYRFFYNSNKAQNELGYAFHSMEDIIEEILGATRSFPSGKRAMQ